MSWAEAQIPMFVCRHCGVFVYSPPIPHRMGEPGESCAEERIEISQVVDAFAAARIEALELSESRLTNALRRIADAPWKSATVTGDLARNALAGVVQPKEEA